MKKPPGKIAQIFGETQRVFQQFQRPARLTLPDDGRLRQLQSVQAAPRVFQLPVRLLLRLGGRVALFGGKGLLTQGEVAFVLQLGVFHRDDGQHHDDRHHAHRQQRRQGRPAPAPPRSLLPDVQRPGQDRLTGQETAQIRRQVRRRLVALARLLGHRLEADHLQRSGNAIVEAARGAGIFVQYLMQQHAHIAAEGQFAGEQFVQDDAKTVDIAAAIDAVSLAPRLFRRHVRRRAQHLTLRRHGDLTGLALGQAEVHQVRHVPLVQHDVGRFDIAVDDAALVGVLQGVRHGGKEGGGLGRRRPPRRQQVRQRASVNEIADKKGQSLVLADLVDRHDGGVS